MTNPTEPLRQNAQGHYVPESKIKPLDLLRDDTVQKMIQAAYGQRDLLRDFKEAQLSDLGEFLRISAEKYDAEIGGESGGFTLTSFDGCAKVTYQVAKRRTFDERLQVAKSLIDECIHTWSDGINDNVRALLDQAFQVDKEGKVSFDRIISLTKLDMDDDTGKWAKAMQAITDSLTIVGSAKYIRFYERDSSDDDWRPISLDIAKL